MSLSLAGWSPAGIAAAILIVLGIALLVAYVFERGLHSRALDGTEPDHDDLVTEARPAAGAGTTASPRAGRTIGTLGAAILVVGLVLGLASAAGGWGASATSGAPGVAPADCAGGWNGCPQATP